MLFWLLIRDGDENGDELENEKLEYATYNKLL